MAISASEYKRIFEVIDIAYSLHNREEMFNAVCEKLKLIVPFSSAVYVSGDPKTANFQFKKHALYNHSEKLLHLFINYYSKLHPYGQSGKWVYNINKSVRLTDIIPSSRLAETEYSRDFQSLEPWFYELNHVISFQGDHVGIIGLHRKKNDGDFTDHEKEIMNILIPHLTRALHNLDLIQNIPNLSKRHIPKVQQVEDKIIILEPTIYNELSKKLSYFGLTTRQKEIVQMMICGISNKDMAKRLNLSEQTIKDYLSVVYKKVRVRGRGELTAKLLGINLLPS